jgi:hypothetical protein
MFNRLLPQTAPTYYPSLQNSPSAIIPPASSLSILPFAASSSANKYFRSGV